MPSFHFCSCRILSLLTSTEFRQRNIGLRKQVNILFTILTSWQFPLVGCYASLFLPTQRQPIAAFVFTFLHCTHVHHEVRSERSLWGWNLSFHPVGSGSWTQVVRSQGKHLYLLSHLAILPGYCSLLEQFVLCDMRLSCLSCISGVCFQSPLLARVLHGPQMSAFHGSLYFWYNLHPKQLPNLYL